MAFSNSSGGPRRFGCCFTQSTTSFFPSRIFLPQVELNAHTTIQSTASRTRLTQTFANDTKARTPEIEYHFPLYDGVSIVSFRCTIGDKVIVGVVKEKNVAKQQYRAAVDRGEVAGLLEQSYAASDVFSTSIGNIPENGKAVIEIEYVAELKHDAQLDGIRFAIPTFIPPRYNPPNPGFPPVLSSVGTGNIDITVDIEADETSHIERVSSPSHQIAVTLGKTTTKKDNFRSSCASASLSSTSAELAQDFVIVFNVTESETPRALLEEHPDIVNHRALMATLVPKFELPNIHPEIVFIVDRSGSMAAKIGILVEALRVFLKSLPLSAKFNICSFGSTHSFLFPKSRAYDEMSLWTALSDIDTFQANYGGTELFNPIKAVIENRLPGVPLEIMVLTDGEIWNQQVLFDLVNESAKSDVRLFSLGIGHNASTSLVEGLARAGNGFAQFALGNEKFDKLIVRMLKAALSPHITDYRLEVNYGDEGRASSEDHDFEMVESLSSVAKDTIPHREKKIPLPKPVSLFDPNFQEKSIDSGAGRFDHLPSLDVPKVLQAPNKISALFPFNRTCVYLLLPNATKPIESITLKGTYRETPVQLVIPVQDIGKGKTIHQLAAKKAMLEIEEGRGWLASTKDTDRTLLRTKYEADWQRFVEREAVRLGVEFQVAGKYCSFVAVEKEVEKQGKLLHVSEPAPEVDEPRKRIHDSMIALQNSANQIINPAGFSNASHHMQMPPPGFNGLPVFGQSNGNHMVPEYQMRLLEMDRSRKRSTMNRDSVQSRAATGASQGGQSGDRGTTIHAHTSFRRHSRGSVEFDSIQAESVPAGVPIRSEITSGMSGSGGALFGSSGGGFGSATGVPQGGQSGDRVTIRRETRDRRKPSHDSVDFETKQAESLPSGIGSGGFGSSGRVCGSFGGGFGAATGANQGGVFGAGVGGFGASGGASQYAGGPPGPMNVFGNVSSIQYSAPSDSALLVGALPTSTVNPFTQPASTTTFKTIETRMHQLIGLQRFDGSWSASDELFQITQVWAADFEDADVSYEDQDVKATLFAVAWLEKEAAKEVEVWEMVAEKAKQWLADKHGITDFDAAVRRAITIFFP